MHNHDDIINWKHFPRYWPFVRGIHRSQANSPHKSEWRGALIFSLICAWTNDWVNNPDAGDLRRHRTRYDVTVMQWCNIPKYLHIDGLALSCFISIEDIKNNAWVTVNNNFFVTSEAIRRWFSRVTKSRVKIIAESPHDQVARLLNHESRECRTLALWRHICRLFLHAQIGAKAIFTSE